MKKIVSVLLSATMVAAMNGAIVFASGETDAKTSASDTAAAAITGWKTVGSKKYYYVNDQKVTGLYKVGSHYYFFNKSGVMQKGKVKSGKTTYYLLSNGVLDVKKVGKSAYYNKNNQRIDYWDGYEYETILTAKKIVAKITKKSDSKATKRLKAFKWVQAKTYQIKRDFHFQKGWMALYANDHFKPNYKGDCHADGCAFAYLAYVIGYKNVRVVCDSKKGGNSNHCFTEINGRVYDPLFATSYGLKNNYNVSYKTYRDGKAVSFKVPYATMKAVKK
jgi:hypothetical protein